jgi:hypothetical protein
MLKANLVCETGYGNHRVLVESMLDHVVIAEGRTKKEAISKARRKLASFQRKLNRYKI